MSTIKNASIPGSPSQPAPHRTEPGNEPSIPAHAIVVGLDQSPQSMAALEWATAEAVSRGLPLHLMHAVQPPLWRDSHDTSEFESDPAGCVTEALRALTDSGAGVAVTWSQPYGSALPALTWASRFATLVVVGTRAHGPLQQVVTGSAAVELVADARCPVVVVRSRPGGLRSGPVVVGLEDGTRDRDAIQAAFREAEAGDRSLVVVHATENGFLERGRIERIVAATAQHHPAVGVTVHVTDGHPTELLVAHSERASLLVLGSRGRHEVSGVVLGSVSQPVLRHAACPVLVAREGTVRPRHTVTESATTEGIADEQ